MRLRQEKGKILPTIVGVPHHPESIHRVKEIINALPPDSTIGLERDGRSVLPESTRPDGKGAFFSLLKEHAEQLGHRVVWLERKASFTAGTPAQANGKRFQDKLDGEIAEIRKRDIGLPARIRLERRATRKARARFTMQALYGDVVDLSLAPWRSRNMARTMTKTQWKGTDIAIMGGSHALDVKHLLNAKVNLVLGNTPKERASNWYFLHATQALTKEASDATETKRKIVKAWKKSIFGKNNALGKNKERE